MDSKSVMTTVLFPVALSTSSLKNFPTPKAMNARAMSLTKLILSISVCGTAPRSDGPMRIPAIIYPVTFGNLQSLVSRVTKKPASSITDSETSIIVTLLMDEYIFSNIVFLLDSGLILCYYYTYENYKCKLLFFNSR